ncbi:hypothetical protein MOUN0_D00848 [Monosporozyma unispora]|nr:hypothetical protein C6P44_004726 [Kazachstania unispora]
MIEIVYPAYQGDKTEVENQNASKFKSLKIAGDFNNWQIEPMILSKVDSKPVWIYQIKDSLLSNCKNLNDKNEILVHFKFIDDNENWFIVPDYASEPDEHNNINNVKVAKPNAFSTEQDDKVERDATTEVVNDGPESPSPSLKDMKLPSEEPIIETPEATPEVGEQRKDDIVIEEEEDNDVEDAVANNDASEATKEEHPVDIPDEVIEEPDSVEEDKVPLPNNTTTTINNNDNILEECPENTPDVTNTQIPSESNLEAESKPVDNEQDSKSKIIEQPNDVVPVVKEENVTNEKEEEEETITKIPQPPTPSGEVATDKHTVKAEFTSPKKIEEPDSTNMLDSPVAPVAVSAAQLQDDSNTEIEIDVENHDLTVKNKNTEEYQNILRRLVKGFCSWFSWLFGIFHSHGEQSH